MAGSGQVRRPRDRDSSASRHRERKRRREDAPADKRDRERKDKERDKDRGKERKSEKKRNRDEECQRRGARPTHPDEPESREPSRKATLDQPQDGDLLNIDTGSKTAGSTGPSEMSKSRDWRQDMAANDEDERELSDDEEAAERKAAERRKRREEIMAKFSTKDTPEKPTSPPDVSQDSLPPLPTKDGGVPRNCLAVAGNGAGDIKMDGTDANDVVAPNQEDSVEASQEPIPSPEPKKSEEGAGDMFNETAAAAAALNTSLKNSESIGVTGASGHDWDDEDGYYTAEIGELMDGRYLVQDNGAGKGVFANVLKAKDQQGQSGTLVAIKVVRANDMMNKAAEKEIEILQLLNKADRGNKRHIIKLIDTFYYRKHLSMVFECMADDMRGALKKFTKGKGMSINAIRAYSKQLVIGLRHMHRCKIIHADIKPDNILMCEEQKVVKFCDLGNAFEFKDVAVTPYLVSRFYRAAEIILGCTFDAAVDTFALACTLSELFTGKILLQSKSNNEHLKAIMELKGKIPRNVIKKGMLWKNHFDDDLDFKFESTDKVTEEQITRTITDLSKKRHLKDLMLERVGPERRQSTTKEDELYVKRAIQFADLLEHMLALDPDKRIKPDDALAHIFCSDGPPPKSGPKSTRA